MVTSLALGACAPAERPVETTGSRASALTGIQLAKLLPIGAGAYGHVGLDVALSGDTALVDSIFDDGYGSGTTRASYVFVGSGTTWAQQKVLVPSGPVYSAVSIAGDTAILGAADHAPSAGPGTAFVYVRSGATWTLQQVLAPSDSSAVDHFGHSVFVSGDTALVGAPGKAVGTGAVYVFVRSGASWTQQQKLTAADGASGNRFGTKVALSGETALVSAPEDDDKGVSSGSAYVFVRSGTSWTQQQKLLASDGAAYDGFGTSVSLSGDTAAAGAFGDQDKGTASGSAYVFVRSGTSWSQQQKLLASDGAAGDDFGTSVSLFGDTLVVGAPGDDHVAFDAGSAYVFLRTANTWVEQNKLVASDAVESALFGHSVSLSGDTVLAGAPEDSEKGEWAGAAYVFRLTGGTCTSASQCGTGHCVDGVCCTSACSSPCQACTKAKGATVDGVCATLPAGKPGSPSCAPYLCDGVTVGCPTQCTAGSACSTGNCADGVCCDKPCAGICEACVQAKTGKPDGTCAPFAAGTDPDAECKDDGAPTCQQNGACDGAGACQKYPTASGCTPSPCTSGAECASGFCADGICCDKACTGQCKACSAAKKGAGADGICDNIVADTDPDGECKEDDDYPASCKADGQCDGQGACRTIAKTGTPCDGGVLSCAGNAVKGKICDGTGPNCVLDNKGTDCAPYLCVSSSCSTACASDVECVSTAFCTISGSCNPKQANGKSCTRKEECESGLCVDGYCCSGPCAGQCEACDVEGAEGACVPVVGAPHSNRPACPEGSAGAPCSAAICNGKITTTCAGFVGSTVVCSAAQCSGSTLAPEAHCDGAGACKQPGSVDCGAYQCKDGACGTSCASDSDCAADYGCTSDKCVLQAVCDGDHTVKSPVSGETDCSPYKCTVTGSCLANCSSAADCVTGHTCSSSKQCVPRAAPTEGEEGGCGCRLVGPERGPVPWLAALAAVAAARLRRRRSRV